MLKLFGFLSIIAAAVYAGLSLSRERTRRCKALQATADMITLIKNEVTNNKTPIPRLLAELERSDNADIARFAGCVAERGDGESFSECWSTAAETELSLLPEHAINALKSLGSVLGRFDAAAVGSAADRAAELISAELQRDRGTLSTDKRMYLGLTAGGGAMLALLLL